jgi:hypothetical protein
MRRTYRGNHAPVQSAAMGNQVSRGPRIHAQVFHPLRPQPSSMVSKVLRDGLSVYVCDRCRSGYSDASTADRCELWCRTHQTCNPGITKDALLPPDQT